MLLFSDKRLKNSTLVGIRTQEVRSEPGNRERSNHGSKADVMRES